MAAMILSMLFVGIGMVSSVQPKYPGLVKFHETMGLCVLLLAAIRLVVRARRGAPPLPASLPLYAKIAAISSHYILYGLMFCMPLIGWAMTSSAGMPIRLGPLYIPSVLATNEPLHTWFLRAHVWLGLGFFALIMLHLSAALFHGFVRRDGVLSSMTSGKD
jgi:cytochrome b561